MSGRQKMSTKTSWFGVRMILQSVALDENSRDRMYEERVILVRAATEGEARAKAENFGKASEEEYRNVDGKRSLGTSKKFWMWPPFRGKRESKMEVKCTSPC